MKHAKSECEKLAQKGLKRRHHNVAKKINWDLCKKHALGRNERLYGHNPKGRAENDNLKLLCVINIQ